MSRNGLIGLKSTMTTTAVESLNFEKGSSPMAQELTPFQNHRFNYICRRVMREVRDFFNTLFSFKHY